MRNAGSNSDRARRFMEAMRLCPSARDSELKEFEVFRFDTSGEFRIVDLGGDEGYLARYLAKSFSNSKIHAVDCSPFALTGDEPGRIVAALGDDSCLAFSDSSVDLVFSLAGMHHCRNRLQTFLEVQRVLSPVGKFLVADVITGTPAQRFFEEVVGEFGVNRKDAVFLDEKEMSALAHASGFVIEDFKMKDTPWQFETSRQLYGFVKEFLGLNISEPELEFRVARYFGVYPRPGKVELPWQLGYYTLGRGES